MNCNATLISGSPAWKYQCTWNYSEDRDIVLPDEQAASIVTLDPTNDNPIEEFLRNLKVLLEEKIVVVEDSDADERPGALVQPSLADLDPEVRIALNKLGECQFGDGVWSGIVANYTREVPAELPIFTSGLDKQRVLGQLAKNFEECKGKTNYPWLSQQYEDVYLADLLGLDRFDRSELDFGLDMSRNYEEQRTASAEDIQAEQDRVTYPDWYVNPYQELTGVNRGNPEPIVRDQDAYNEYISDLAASIQTPADTERAYTKALVAMCDTYEEMYKYKVRTYIENGHTVTDYSNYPEWLMHCVE